LAGFLLFCEKARLNAQSTLFARAMRA